MKSLLHIDRNCACRSKMSQVVLNVAYPSSKSTDISRTAEIRVQRSHSIGQSASRHSRYNSRSLNTSGWWADNLSFRTAMNAIMIWGHCRVYTILMSTPINVLTYYLLRCRTKSCWLILISPNEIIHVLGENLKFWHREVNCAYAQYLVIGNPRAEGVTRNLF